MLERTIYNEEHEIFRDAFRKFLEKEVVPHREEWENLAIGRLSMGDVIRLLTLGSELRRHARSSTDILRDMEAVVRGESRRVPDAAD